MGHRLKRKGLFIGINHKGRSAYNGHFEHLQTFNVVEKLVADSLARKKKTKTITMQLFCV